MKNLIGIMQGRLSPQINNKIQAFPYNSWEQEFHLAKDIGLDSIDWIVEGDKFDENPLFTAQGEMTIRELISKTKVNIAAVCADYFMDYPLLRCSDSELKQRSEVLELLINRLNHFGIKFLEIPFVDNSAIKNKTELEQIIQIIKPILDKADQMGVTLAFETSLPPEIFYDFLQELNHPSARANYDMGNSASLGYDPKEELKSYGEFVVTVHIKDRLLKGGTVSLGQGNTDFAACFSMLRAKNYAGPFILQTARIGNEIDNAKKNIAFIKKFMCE